MKSSTTSAGSDVPATIQHIRNAGWSIRRLARDLGVSRSTVYRWCTGTQPREVNYLALREWVDMTFALEAGKRRLTVASLRLQEAAEALETDTERAEADWLAADINAHRAEGARLRAEEAAQRTPYRSITQDADPFGLCQPVPALPF